MLEVEENDFHAFHHLPAVFLLTPIIFFNNHWGLCASFFTTAALINHPIPSKTNHHLIETIMVLILDNSSPADIVIVMPKPDATILARDEFSYSNLYSFDYDATADGATSTSVASKPPMQGSSSDESVSCLEIWLLLVLSA
jgi:hypothetical protein